MIYYSTQRIITPTEGEEQRAIDDAIERGLSALSAEAGCTVILVNVVPVVIPTSTSCVCLIIMARPYDAAQSNVAQLPMLGSSEWLTRLGSAFDAKERDN